MIRNYKPARTQFFNFSQGSYLERTSRPVYAILYLLPFIVLYEVGTILINTDILSKTQVRVVAFVWLQELLAYFGFNNRIAWMAPPMVVILILLGMQFSSRKKWRFRSKDCIPMTIECVLFAIPLIIFSLFLSSANYSSYAAGINTKVFSVQSSVEYSPDTNIHQTTSNEQPVVHFMADAVTGIGAGIYEELVFRLILICLLMLLFHDILKLNMNNSIIISVLISAALFSAHHHIVFIDGCFCKSSAFNLLEFGFRTVAGIYFAVLFACRGFGITAGTHIFYDIIATAVNSLFFHA